MPIYTYHCPRCSKEFEKQLPVKDYKEPQNCPECGEIAEKTLNTVSLSFGKGFEKTGGY